MIKLEPFSDQNAELVLSWRNSDRVRENSIDDSVISRKNHDEFVRKIEKDTSRRYFVVSVDGSRIAVISFSGVGSNAVLWGCYIGTDRLMPGVFPLLVAVAIRFAFQFPNTGKLISEVAQHNKSPQTLNKFLGLDLVGTLKKHTSSGREVNFLQYELSQSQAENAMKKIRKTLTASMRNLIDQFEGK